ALGGRSGSALLTDGVCTEQVYIRCRDHSDHDEQRDDGPQCSPHFDTSSLPGVCLLGCLAGQSSFNGRGGGAAGPGTNALLPRRCHVLFCKGGMSQKSGDVVPSYLETACCLRGRKDERRFIDEKKRPQSLGRLSMIGKGHLSL